MSQEEFDKQREMIHRNMLSSVSHDLKTPLASIIGSLEIHERMKDKLPQDKKETLIATALQEAYRLDNFVTNILEMAKLENSMVRIQVEPCNVGNIVRDCTIRLGHRLEGVSVSIDAPTGEFSTMTDPAMLSRAIMQVMDNAVKYGGSPSEIAIRYANDADGRTNITIQDNGKGIPEDRQELVFEKYTRFAKLDQQAAGTGLGLSICREIMRLLGGTVSVKNGTNGGAVFTLTIPK